jgi:tRNA-dihydrouridine synthase
MNNPMFLAPMAELSHRALRELIDEFSSCDEYFTEMISSAALLAGGPYEKWYIDTAPNPKKLVFQLVGSEIDQISHAAALLDRLECKGIDINMGCSAPLIRKNGAGAAWMASIDRAGELIAFVRPQVKRRLSVKLRIGFKDDFEYLVNFCRRLEDEGIELITLHPRLVTEKFKRLARWDYVGGLRKELRIPVAGNGDIACAEDVLRRADSCDAVMVGRAAIRQPWIFAQVAGLAPTPNIEQTGLRFLELLLRYQPPEFHRSRALRFFSFFCDNCTWGNYLKTKLNREETISGMERVWRDYFLEH